MHADACFVTLTYDKEHLPEGGTLVPKHLQDFMKRIRYYAKDQPIRYFGVGEYGEQTWRPHYHLALFGIGVGQKGLVASAWKAGFHHVGSLTFESAQYIAGYIPKKLTNASAPSLSGRYPEFARMSLRPGIGAGSVESIAEAVRKADSLDKKWWDGDVPDVLKHGQRTLPLGPYLRRRLRASLERVSDEPDFIRPELQAMRDRYWFTTQGENISFKTFLQKMNHGKILRIERRAKLKAGGIL